ncbi:MAG: protein-export chaperone SecB [Bacteroidetes bacterium]|nr:protein-export chaperone SecB [Bacteroidota bacterium]MBL0064586.1 protein-export chaperone SecB [Bacteroidota bacterium]
MEKQENNPGYKIVQIILLESNFKRIRGAKFDPKPENSISVNLAPKINQNVIDVTVELNYKQNYNGHEQASCKILMTGVFEKQGDVKPSSDYFANVNAPSIIFPFIREHLTSLCMKGGIGMVLLPPVNFQKMFEDKSIK